MSIIESSSLIIEFSGSTFVILYTLNILYILNIGAHNVFASMPASEANILRRNNSKNYSQEQGSMQLARLSKAKLSRQSDKYLKSGVSKKIIHVIKHANFQLYRAYSERVIWKV